MNRNDKRELAAMAGIAMIIAPFLVVGGCLEMADRQRQEQLEQDILVDEPDVIRPADWPQCTYVKPGPIQRPDGFNPQPYGRKKDVA